MPKIKFRSLVGNKVANVAAKLAVLLLHIRDVPGESLDTGTSYPD
jgi:hypothetical protein